MRQLLYSAPRVVEWAETPDAVLEETTDAIVEPLAVARCDLDLPMVQAGLFPGPFAVGHEVAGRVVEVGADTRRVKVGDLVVVPFQVSCGSCAACRRTQFAACASCMAAIGGSFGFGRSGGDYGGGLADRLRVPYADHLLVPAPPGVDLAHLATLSDNVVDGYRAVGPVLKDRPGEEVLIVAASPGSLALYVAAFARALGSPVRYVDRDPARVALAAKLGANVLLHEGAWPRRFPPAPVTVDVTGDEGGLACVLRSTERYGYCTSLAIHFGPEPALPMLELYTRGITFHTSRADARRYLPAVIDLVTAGAFDPASVPISTVAWEQAPAAWLEPALKLVVVR